MKLMGRPAKLPQPKYGKHLAELRKSAGLSQSKLANILNTRQSTVASWEHSDSPPKGSILPELADALNVSLDVLLCVEPISNKHPGPASKIEKLFSEVSQLPRRKQQRIATVIEALLIEEITQ